MPRQFRIRVYGAQRNNIDPALLAQLVILFGRHLHEKHRQHSNNRAAKDTTASQDQPPAQHHEDHPEPPPDDTPLKTNERELS